MVIPKYSFHLRTDPAESARSPQSGLLALFPWRDPVHYGYFQATSDEPLFIAFDHRHGFISPSKDPASVDRQTQTSLLDSTVAFTRKKGGQRRPWHFR
ncbi:MAG: hypothetical protein R3F36_02675 [Candidatus Competibacteraceae bacterium]